VQRRHEDLKEAKGIALARTPKVRDEIIEDPTELLEGEFIFTEVERQPVKHDLETKFSVGPSIDCRIP